MALYKRALFISACVFALGLGLVKYFLLETYPGVSMVQALFPMGADYVHLLLISALIPLLIATVTFLLLTTRERAGLIAERMLSDVLSSRELLLTVYRNSPVPYLLISHKGHITFPNDAALRLLGITATELEGSSLFDILLHDDETKQTHLDLVPVRFERGVPVSNEEALIKRTDGTLRWVSLSLYPFKTPGGVVNGLAALVDITKPKEIDKAKTEFVSLASHQLRTPIAAIQWHLELLGSPKLGALTDAQRTDLKR
jgi:PAS domain S-box-containing protein